MRARVPSLADTSLSAASGLREAAELNPRSALQRKQKIQMELGTATAPHRCALHRRTSQKRMRQATPTKGVVVEVATIRCGRLVARFAM